MGGYEVMPGRPQAGRRPVWAALVHTRGAVTRRARRCPHRGSFDPTGVAALRMVEDGSGAPLCRPRGCRGDRGDHCRPRALAAATITTAADGWPTRRDPVAVRISRSGQRDAGADQLAFGRSFAHGVAGSLHVTGSLNVPDFIRERRIRRGYAAACPRPTGSIAGRHLHLARPPATRDLHDDRWAGVAR